MSKSYIIGSTVSLTIKFISQEDGVTLVDQSGITIKVFDYNQVQIGTTISVSDSYRISTGYYAYKYTVPNNPPYIYVEWSGTNGAYTDVSRDKIDVNWSEDDVNEAYPVTITVGTNSYITLADANTYFGTRLFSDSWNNSTESNKSLAILSATKKIDRLVMRGVKSISTQSLAFPRAIYSDYYTNDLPNLSLRINGNYNVETSVSQRVIDACCEEAMAMLAVDASGKQRQELQNQGVTSFSMSKLSENYSKIKVGSTNLLSSEAKELLFYYTGGSVNIR